MLAKLQQTTHESPSHLAAESRGAVAEQLNARLADGLDLHSQIKVAHWNVKGPHFAALHPLFESFAVDLANSNDAIAERAVTLGGVAYGTARHVAAASSLPEYPHRTTRGLEHARLLLERFNAYLAGLRATRAVAEKHGDIDTVDLLTQTISQFEKHAWFLAATTAEG